MMTARERGEARNWIHVTKTDVRARLLADRHYSRQTIGAAEICPPGNSIVLIIPDGAAAAALWVSHRPDPKAALLKRRADGFDYFDNPYFRNESGVQSSTLIREALAITRYLWQDYDPPDGFHTFVNPRKVKPIIRRGEPYWGYCFLKAGFTLWPERTKSRDLLRFVMPLEQLLSIEPIAPRYEQMRLLA